MRKEFARAVILALVVIGIVGGLGFYFSEVRPPHQVEEYELSDQITLSIDGVYREKAVSVSRGESVLQVLQTLDAQDPILQLATKDYPGMGTLVTRMGMLENGDRDKYWQYKVDGVMPQIGADAYVLNGGETVEWSFAASQF